MPRRARPGAASHRPAVVPVLRAGRRLPLRRGRLDRRLPDWRRAVQRVRRTGLLPAMDSARRAVARRAMSLVLPASARLPSLLSRTLWRTAQGRVTPPARPLPV